MTAQDLYNLFSDPELVKVREWRHRVQRTFLSRERPEEDVLPMMDKLFTDIENYEMMTVEYLKYSKLHKVLRHVHLIDPKNIPRGDDEFKFRDRAGVLLDKWQRLTSASQAAPDSASAAIPEAAVSRSL
ncbi:hypothetical protein B0H10DRAFT_2027912 [Mycena sp. CBHHK59/15]|nr:hypothetical protein B0H10DRAFT_2027912 [Mycena sp. CBHHK59/15]